MSTENTHLAKIPPLYRALALATEAGDVVGLRDVAAMATALQKGARARGMGIAAENAAAEVVLRAERAIGLSLVALKAAGRVGPGLSMKGAKPAAKGQSRVRDEVASADFIPLSSLGITSRQSYEYQRLAAVPSDRFESLLNDVRGAAQRLAKVNFYAPVKRPKDVVEAEKAQLVEVRSTVPFDQFRAGVYALIGWTVDEDGKGSPRENALDALPADELVELASLIRVLVAEYQRAFVKRSQR